MAHKCNIENLYGAIQARAAIDDGPIFKNGNINSAPPDAMYAYASILNKKTKAAVDIGKTVRALAEGKQKLVESNVGRLVNSGRTWEAIVPEKVFAKADKMMTRYDKTYKTKYLPQLKRVQEKFKPQFEAAKGDKAKLNQLEIKMTQALKPIRDEAKAHYKDTILPRIKEAREQLQSAFNAADGNDKKLDARLKAIGLNRNEAYFTNQYLAHLENGASWFDLSPQGGADLPWLKNVVSATTKNKVRYNLMTSFWNLAEFAQKAPAVYEMNHITGGIKDALSAAKKEGVSIWEKLPSLEKKGVYDTDYDLLRSNGRFDPLNATQNWLDNLAYHVGANAGDATKGMKEIAYKPKPWNDTALFADKSAKSYLQFASFQLRHFQQYGGWVRDVVSSDVPKAQRIQSLKALGAYSATTALLFGPKAAVPAPLFYLGNLADKDLDKQLHDLGKIVGLDKGLVGVASSGKVDLGTYAQPLGGIPIGVGVGAVGAAKDTATSSIPRAKTQLEKGRPDKATALLLDAAVRTSQIFENGAPAALQKVVSGITKAYVKDATPAEYGDEIGKQILGREAISDK
jgi:hypothetical protein